MRQALNPVFLAILITSLLLTGCSSRIASRRVAFDDQEAQTYKQYGTSIVVGQAFLTTRGGDIKYAAGKTVWLAPFTEYNKEFLLRSIQGDETLEEADPRNNIFRSTLADAQGNFRFERVPPGNYVVYSFVYWNYVAYVTQGVPIEQQTGRAAMSSVFQVRDGETVKVVAN